MKFDSNKMRDIVIKEVNDAVVDVIKAETSCKNVDLPSDFKFLNERKKIYDYLKEIDRKMELLVNDLNGTVEKFEKAESKNISTAYQIKPGDYLIKIAREHGYSDSDYIWLAKLNNIKNPNLIYPDDTLYIPDKDSIGDFDEFKKKVMNGEITLDNLKEQEKVPKRGNNQTRLKKEEQLEKRNKKDAEKAKKVKQRRDEQVKLKKEEQLEKRNKKDAEKAKKTQKRGNEQTRLKKEEQLENRNNKDAEKAKKTQKRGNDQTRLKKEEQLEKRNNKDAKKDKKTVNPEDVLLNGGAAAVIDGAGSVSKPKANPEQIKKETKIAYDKLSIEQKNAISGKSFEEIINLINSGKLKGDMALITYLNYIKPDNVAFVEDLIDSKNGNVTGNNSINENSSKKIDASEIKPYGITKVTKGHKGAANIYEDIKSGNIQIENNHGSGKRA